MISPQSYPRIEDDSDRYNGFLDDSKLVQHFHKISEEELESIARNAIIQANLKSSRTILKVTPGLSEEQTQDIYSKEGKELFKYFVRYCGDPALTAYQTHKKHYSIVAKEQFRNRTLQKERMNSGWRYQFIAKDAAISSKRFVSVSDIGASEADFNVIIKYLDKDGHLSVYTSVKNRTNTMGGQDWPKAIRSIEDVARTDKNRTGPYICVFGIAMEKGTRLIKIETKTKMPYSFNTEVWMSDFFWPFFTNYSYEEIIRIVFKTLVEEEGEVDFDWVIPDTLVESFGQMAKEKGLLDDEGNFNNPELLISIFCGSKK